MQHLRLLRDLKWKGLVRTIKIPAGSMSCLTETSLLLKQKKNRRDQPNSSQRFRDRLKHKAKLKEAIVLFCYATRTVTANLKSRRCFLMDCTCLLEWF